MHRRCAQRRSLTCAYRRVAPYARFRSDARPSGVTAARSARDLAERVDVRVLLWGGAPLPVFTPARAAVRRVREELIRGTRVQCALDFHERPMHCHHEKLVIVDGEVAFVGGIDLTSLGGDRFDSSDHLMHGRLGWHDASSRRAWPRGG